MMECSIYSRFVHVAEAHPARTALVVEDHSYTYGDLRERIDAFARGLLARDCTPSDAVAILFPNSLDFIVAVLGTFAVGAKAVPLNPNFKLDEIEHALTATAARFVLAPTKLLEALPDVPASSDSVDAWSAPAEPLDAPSRRAEAAVYMFSSGSTGRSKRITRSEAQLLAEYDALRRTIDLLPSDCILCTIPLFHAHGFGNALFAALLTGAKLVLRTKEFNPRSTMRALVEHGVTLYPAVPFMFKMLAETRFAEPPDLRAVRLLFSAGAALPESVSRSFLERFGHPVAQLFGSTETGALSINVAHPREKPTSVGRPLHGYAIEIRDEAGRALPSGTKGEIWVKSPAMTRAYDGLDDMTTACFVDGYFFTGDLGTMDDDGDLYIAERKKLLINVAGFKVDPLEVEQVLARHPGVADVVVVGAPHPGYGEEVKAVVVAKAEDQLSAEALGQYAAEHLTEYKVPKRIEFIAEIPRSPLGKVLRKYL